MLVIFDVETTGFKQNHVVELASVISCSNGDNYCWYNRMKPSSPIEDGAAAVTGITNSIVANEPPDTEKVVEWWADIQSVYELGGLPMVLAGHNVRYDIQAVCQYVDIPKSVLTLCTMRLGRLYSPKSPNHKLTTLHEYLGLVGDYKAHGALDDVFMAEGILNHYIKETGKTYWELAQEQSKPVALAVMPFGKHVGSPFNLIPSDYMTYMLGLPNLDIDVRYSFQLDMARRARRWPGKPMMESTFKKN